MNKEQIIKNLKKELLKSWGKPCKDFSPLCCVCLIWRAFETMDKLYDEKSHLSKWDK